MIPITRQTIRTHWKPAFYTGLGLSLVAFLFASLHDQLKSDIDKFIDVMPEGMEAIIGNMSNATTPEGWLSIEFFALFIPLAISILAISIGARIIGNEESSGTLELLLSRPISRHRLVIEKVLALSTIVALPMIMIWFSIFIGKLFFPFDVNLLHVAQALLSGWMLGLLFGIIAFATQAFSGTRGIATAVGAGLLGLSWIVDIVSKLISSLEDTKYASALYYYNNPGTLLNGIDWLYAGILFGLIIICYGLAHLGFANRDIGT